MKTHKKTFLVGTAYFFLIFFLLLTLVSSPPFIGISSAVCALFHEAAHILCARAFGRKIKPLSFSPTGLYPDVGRGSTLSQILIYAAGPFVNLAICAVCLLVLRSNYSETVFSLFCVNAALALYNLTPVPFSDGGGIMRCVLTAFLGARVGGALCAMLELLFSFALFVFFSYRFFALGSGFFPFFCSFVFMLTSIQPHIAIT